MCWDALDVDLSVPDLLLATCGRAPFMGALGSLGGRATSESKVARARQEQSEGWTSTEARSELSELGRAAA